MVETRTFDAPAATDAQVFRFKVPEGPYSFLGRLISLIWSLELVAPGSEVARVDVVVSPTAQEIQL